MSAPFSRRCMPMWAAGALIAAMTGLVVASAMEKKATPVTVELTSATETPQPPQVAIGCHKGRVAGVIVRVPENAAPGDYVVEIPRGACLEPV